jgi:hypothetical protein
MKKCFILLIIMMSSTIYVEAKTPTTTPPGPSCGIRSIVGESPAMVDATTYSVTVNWTGSEDDGNLISAGGTPTSVATSTSNGMQVFTFTMGQPYSLTFSDTDNSCSALTPVGLSGPAPTFTFGGGPTTPVETIPTLGEWGIMIMFFSLLIIGLVYMRNVYVSTKKAI